MSVRKEIREKMVEYVQDQIAKAIKNELLFERATAPIGKYLEQGCSKGDLRQLVDQALKDLKIQIEKVVEM